MNSTITKALTLAFLVLTAGCASMTPTQKKAAWIAAGVVVTSVAISVMDSDYTDQPCLHYGYRTDVGALMRLE